MTDSDKTSRPGLMRALLDGGIGPLVATLAMQMMSTGSQLTVPVLASAAAADIGISATYVGVFVSIIGVAAMISSVVGSSLVVRFGAIRLSQACLLLCAAGLAMVMLAVPWALVIGAILIGSGCGPVTPASSHILAKTTPPHLTGVIFSIKQTGVPLGGALAGVLVPPVVQAAGWRTGLAVMAVIALAVAICAQPVRARLDDDRQPGRRMRLRDAIAPLMLVLAHGPIRALAYASLFYASMQMCLMAFLVTYLVHDLHLPLIQAGLTLAVAQAGGVTGRIVWGTMADHWVAPMRMFGIVGIMMATGALVTALLSPIWPAPAVLAVCALFGASAAGWNGVHLAQVARLAAPGTVGLATGGSVGFFFLGIVAGPPLFGAIVGAGFGYPAAFTAMAVPALLVGLRFAFGRSFNEDSAKLAASESRG